MGKEWLGGPKAVLSDSYFCIDIETTGLDEKEGDVLEVYYKFMYKGVKVDEGHSLFYSPDWHLTNSINRIPFEELQGRPHFDSDGPEVADFKYRLKCYLESCCSTDSDLTLMAQYSSFEVKWLSEKLGMDLSKVRVYDTHYVETKLYPKLSHSLVSICKRRGIRPPNGVDFHRAYMDVDAMWAVYESQLKDFKKSDFRLYLEQVYYLLKGYERKPGRKAV